jgi:hypothetical protein
MTPDDILANAERLISDARHLFDGGRSRSAATLIVVALEQFGAFVEAFTRDKYPDVSVQMGLFGDKANAHAKRQDALVSYLLWYSIGTASAYVAHQTFIEQTGGGDDEKFREWFRTRRFFGLTAAQAEVLNDHPFTKTANLLLDLARTKRLQHLREFGLYETVETRFCDADIAQALELAETIRQILALSQRVAMPAPPVFNYEMLSGDVIASGFIVDLPPEPVLAGKPVV